MDCQNLLNDDPRWISCDNPAISNTIICTSLNENPFDIEVNASNNNQRIAQFEGSAVGTTIPNLQPGKYTVNEIEGFGNTDQLGKDPDANDICVNLAGFTNGGSFFNGTTFVGYSRICFEYEDEQGNNCNTITLGTGEHRTCTVKNYIRTGDLVD